MTISRKLFYNKFHVTLFIREATVTGKRENKRGNGLELNYNLDYNHVQKLLRKL